MTREEQTSVLKAESLKKSYGRRLVVKGIDIQVSSGHIIGLLGRNGAGKTTTFQMIVGLLKAGFYSGTWYFLPGFRGRGKL